MKKVFCLVAVIVLAGAVTAEAQCFVRGIRGVRRSCLRSNVFVPVQQQLIMPQSTAFFSNGNVAFVNQPFVNQAFLNQAVVNQAVVNPIVEEVRINDGLFGLFGSTRVRRFIAPQQVIIPSTRQINIGRGRVFISNF